MLNIFLDLILRTVLRTDIGTDQSCRYFSKKQTVIYRYEPKLYYFSPIILLFVILLLPCDILVTCVCPSYLLWWFNVFLCVVVFNCLCVLGDRFVVVAWAWDEWSHFLVWWGITRRSHSFISAIVFGWKAAELEQRFLWMDDVINETFINTTVFSTKSYFIIQERTLIWWSHLGTQLHFMQKPVIWFSG